MARPARLVPDGAEDLRRPAPATVKVDWALDGPIPWRNADGRAARARCTSPAAEQEFLRSVEQARDGLPDQPFLLLGQQSVADPTRAPEGKHTAWAYTHGPQQRRRLGGGDAGVVERMEAQVERFAPGFRDRILARHVLGPADLEAPQRQPRRRRRRRRQLPAAPGRLPPAAEALAVPHAAERPVHRQRRDVPRRRGARRARRRRRARRAQVASSGRPTEAVLERVAHELGARGAAQLLLDVRAVASRPCAWRGTAARRSRRWCDRARSAAAPRPRAWSRSSRAARRARGWRRGDPRAQARIEVRVAGGGEPDRPQQLLVGGLLEHEAERARLQRLRAKAGSSCIVSTTTAVSSRQARDRLQARAARHVEVEHEHRRPVRAGQALGVRHACPPRRSPAGRPRCRSASAGPGGRRCGRRR